MSLLLRNERRNKKPGPLYSPSLPHHPASKSIHAAWSDSREPPWSPACSSLLMCTPMEPRVEVAQKGSRALMLTSTWEEGRQGSERGGEGRGGAGREVITDSAWRLAIMAPVP